MQHVESPTKVYRTENYKLFKNIEGNRSLNKVKIKRIIREIQHGNDILDQVPILVAESKGYLDVYDGQHRLEICKQLNRPVHYIIRQPMKIVEVARVNTNVEKWTPSDFINCYVKAGNKNYQTIEDFRDQYRFPLMVILKLLHFGIIGASGGNDTIKAQFEKGCFEVKKHKQAVEVAELCMKFSEFKGYTAGNFVVAICKILNANKCDVDMLVEKFLKDPKRLQVQSTAKAYLTNLEEIYNVGNSKRRVIY